MPATGSSTSSSRTSVSTVFCPPCWPGRSRSRPRRRSRKRRPRRPRPSSSSSPSSSRESRLSRWLRSSGRTPRSSFRSFRSVRGPRSSVRSVRGPRLRRSISRLRSLGHRSRDRRRAGRPHRRPPAWSRERRRWSEWPQMHRSRPGRAVGPVTARTALARASGSGVAVGLDGGGSSGGGRLGRLPRGRGPRGPARRPEPPRRPAPSGAAGASSVVAGTPPSAVAAPCAANRRDARRPADAGRGRAPRPQWTRTRPCRRRSCWSPQVSAARAGGQGHPPGAP